MGGVGEGTEKLSCKEEVSSRKRLNREAMAARNS